MSFRSARKKIECPEKRKRASEIMLMQTKIKCERAKRASKIFQDGFLQNYSRISIKSSEKTSEPDFRCHVKQTRERSERKIEKTEFARAKKSREIKGRRTKIHHIFARTGLPPPWFISHTIPTTPRPATKRRQAYCPPLAESGTGRRGARPFPGVKATVNGTAVLLGVPDAFSMISCRLQDGGAQFFGARMSL